MLIHSKRTKKSIAPIHFKPIYTRVFGLGIIALTSVFCLICLGKFAVARAAATESGVTQTNAESKEDAEAAARIWAKLPKIVARIVPPAFPKRDFVITKFGADGRRVNIPCENIVIRNCRFKAGHGGERDSGGDSKCFR